MASGDAKVSGCLECGAFVEALNERKRCPACGDGLVTELGGQLTSEKAMALMAWARRDATDQIEGYGTLAGAGLGLGLGLLATLVIPGAAAGALLSTLYFTALGGAAGRLGALRAHRVLRPHSRLQPTFNSILRRRLQIATAAGVVVPALFGIALAVFAGPDVGTSLRRMVASVWAWVVG